MPPRMTLREQILRSPETLSDMEWAAEQRFLDGRKLLFAGRFSGAVYLLGLAAEMRMKLCCFYVMGNESQSDARAQLAPARRWMRSHAPQTRDEGYHSLRFWMEFLVLRRIAEGNPLTRQWMGQLRHHIANRLYNDWKIDMRYKETQVSESEAWRVYNDVVWLEDSWDSLRR